MVFIQSKRLFRNSTQGQISRLLHGFHPACDLGLIPFFLMFFTKHLSETNTLFEMGSFWSAQHFRHQIHPLNRAIHFKGQGHATAS